MAKLKIKEVPKITPSGIEMGTEFIVENCPKVMAKVNVKKSCKECFMKEKLSFKNMEVECKMAEAN